jgi:hypothetical protein
MRGYARGRGGYGRGMGFGRSYWPGTAPGGVYGPGLGMVRGNPYPYCRFYPWLPRRWWAMGMNPYGSGPGSWSIQNPPLWPGPQGG